MALRRHRLARKLFILPRSQAESVIPLCVRFYVVMDLNFFVLRTSLWRGIKTGEKTSEDARPADHISRTGGHTLQNFQFSETEAMVMFMMSRDLCEG